MMPSPVLVAMLGLLASAQYVPLERPPGFDGQYQPTTESAHSFECGTIRAGLRFRQERLPEEEGRSLEDSFRVTLLDLTVAGRTVSAANLETGRALFRGFAWIQEVSAMCYAGLVTVNIKGMPLGPYLARLNNSAIDDTPVLRTRSIRLGRNGIDYVSPPSPPDG